MFIWPRLVDFVTADDGATMAEYALMVGFIALALIGAVTTLGQSVSGFFAYAVDRLP